MTATLSINLATAERLVAEGERMIARHRSIAEALENQPGVSANALERARNVVASLEELQARRIATRDQLRRQLAAIERASE
jgi:hypothetical protein